MKIWLNIINIFIVVLLMIDCMFFLIFCGLVRWLGTLAFFSVRGLVREFILRMPDFNTFCFKEGAKTQTNWGSGSIIEKSRRSIRVQGQP